MKTDTTAQQKAPTLVSRLGLPGSGKAGLWAAAFIKGDQRFKNQARESGRAGGGQRGGV